MGCSGSKPNDAVASSASASSIPPKLEPKPQQKVRSNETAYETKQSSTHDIVPTSSGLTSLSPDQRQSMQETEDFVMTKLISSGSASAATPTLVWERREPTVVETLSSAPSTAVSSDAPQATQGLTLNVVLSAPDTIQEENRSRVEFDAASLMLQSTAGSTIAMRTAAKSKLKISSKVSMSVLTKAAALADHSPKSRKGSGHRVEFAADNSSSLDTFATKSAPGRPTVLFGSSAHSDPQSSSHGEVRTRGAAFTRGSFGKMKSIRAPADKAELICLDDDEDDHNNDAESNAASAHVTAANSTDDNDDQQILHRNQVVSAAEDGTGKRKKTKVCDVCHYERDKGVYCDSLEHFVCRSCFADHVSALCRDTASLQTSKSAIYCPCGGCTSAPWNSYHLRKVLTNGYDNVLELYLSTVMRLMQDLNFSSQSRGPGASPLKRQLSQQVSQPPTQSKPAPAANNSKNSNNVSSGTSSTPAVTEPVVVVRFSDEEMQIEFEKLQETVKILRKQLLDHNIEAAEFIPLEVIQRELQEIFAKANLGEPYDAARMDYLLMCMENNPDYLEKQAEEQRQWRIDNAAFCQACYEEMLGYVPPNIFAVSLAALQRDYKISVDMSKRLLTKKCLWLVRCEGEDIDKLHEADLLGRFTFEAQGLDLVELAALYVVVPENFTCDPTGRKQNWRRNLEASLKKCLSDKTQGRLQASKARHPVYKKAVAQFQGNYYKHRFNQEANDTPETPPVPTQVPQTVDAATSTPATATTTPVPPPSSEAVSGLLDDNSTSAPASISRPAPVVITPTATPVPPTDNSSTPTSSPSDEVTPKAQRNDNSSTPTSPPSDEVAAPRAQRNSVNGIATPRNSMAEAAAAMAEKMAARRKSMEKLA